jgi:CheY-like chemotaxis protein
MSTRSYRALILDDDPEWLRMVGKTLRGSDFVIDEAADLVEANVKIDEQNHHLLVLDISLTGANENREWLDLLAKWNEERKTESMKVVVLSHFSNVDHMREAFRAYHVADVQEKQQFDNSVFGGEMRQILKGLEFNPSLMVGWKHEGEAAEAAAHIKLGTTRVKKGTALHQRVMEELDDLLCRLFYDAESIVVSTMPTGRSGAGIIRVDPNYRNGPGSSTVVKFGDVANIEAEQEHYDAYVERRLNRKASILKRARTRLLAGTCYLLLGADEFESYAAFYARANPSNICRVIENLFLSTCANWYTHTNGTTMLDLARVYRDLLGMSPENLTSALRQLSSVQGGETLKFQSLTTQVPIRNPIIAAQKSFMEHIYTCITHGDLNGGNILVDPEGKTWLIDFLRTGEGHVLRDHAFLDLFTRCALLGPDEATLEERLLLEQALLQARKLNAAGMPVGTLRSDNAALQKAFQTSLLIRSLAAKHGRHRNSTEMPDYELATMFYGANMIRFYSLATVQKEHGLLAAGLLAERLRL